MSYGDGLTFGPQFSDPLDRFTAEPQWLRDPLDDFVRKSDPLYPLSNEYKQEQQQLANEAYWLEQDRRQREEEEAEMEAYQRASDEYEDWCAAQNPGQWYRD